MSDTLPTLVVTEHESGTVTEILGRLHGRVNALERRLLVIPEVAQLKALHERVEALERDHSLERQAFRWQAFRIDALEQQQGRHALRMDDMCASLAKLEAKVTERYERAMVGVRDEAESQRQARWHDTYNASRAAAWRNTDDSDLEYRARLEQVHQCAVDAANRAHGSLEASAVMDTIRADEMAAAHPSVKALVKALREARKTLAYVGNWPGQVIAIDAVLQPFERGE